MNNMAAVSNSLIDMMGRTEKARRHLVAIASVLGRANRIVTGEPIALTIAETQPAFGFETPGWTDGETIWLNGPNIRKKLESKAGDQRLILALKGVNYHELAHVLYTPKSGQDISQKVWREHTQASWKMYWYAFNVLEDLRAEMLFVTDYPTAINYYTNTVSEWILDNTANHLDDVWPLLSGRMYLPSDLRRAARNAFALKYGRQVADEVDEIAKKYLRLIYPEHTNKGWLLVSRLAELLFNLSAPTLAPPSGIHHSPEAMRMNGQDKGFKGNSKDTWRQKDAADDRDAFLEELEEEQDQVLYGDDDDDSNDIGSSSAGSSKGESSDDDSEDSGGSGDESDNDQETDDDGGTTTSTDKQSTEPNDDDTDSGSGDGQGTLDESDASTPSGTGEGVSDQPNLTSQGEIREELIDIAEDIVKAVGKMDEVQDDIRSTMDSIRQEINREVKTIEGYKGVFTDVLASGAEKRVVAQLENRLRDLRVDLEPIWMNQQPSGVIDVKAAMLAQPGDLDVFTVWEEGSEEEASTEIVILLDQSSSMDSIMASASTTMWTLKRALDESGITTTVIGYNHDWQVLYQPHDKAMSGKVRRFPSSGNTNPIGALRQAEAILRGSRATNRLLVSITDGQWILNQPTKYAIDVLRKVGVKTYMVNIGYDSHYQVAVKEMKSDDIKLCYHEKGYYLGKIENIVPIVGSLVTELMREVSAATAVRH